jgi:nicotinate-nucleotide--dimethylbenzimidazole phosphoribosyltransferase
MQALAAVRARDPFLTKPPGALGRLEEIVEWLAMWSGKPKPSIIRPLVAVFAGNHGVTAQGVSPYPSEVTQQMVANFAAGGAAINQICIAHDLGLKVFDLALDIPTADITVDAAMDEKSCAATMAFGMEAISGGTDLLCIGEMGIGNTTIASALLLGLFGGTAEDWVGAGTGSLGDVLARKVDAVRRAHALHAAHLNDPLEVLRRLGGRELAAMTGAILAARMQRVPVIVDGFVAAAAAAVLFKCDPAALDHCLFGHVSAEKAHGLALQKLGKKPLLDLGMRLGEGTGAALAAGIVKSAALCHSGMATFGEAGVTDKA